MKISDKKGSMKKTKEKSCCRGTMNSSDNYGRMNKEKKEKYLL